MRALWLPRTRSRSPGHSARSSTRRSSRQASGWATVDQVNRRFAVACAAAGLEGRRTSHGGRVGLAVELTARGAATHAVQLCVARAGARADNRTCITVNMKDLPARIDPDEAAVDRPTQTGRRLVEASVRPNTRRAYAGALRRLDAWLDGRPLHDGSEPE